MTNISILGGDFEILMADETVGANAVAGMKMVRRASGAGTTVYTTNQLYSAIAEQTDEFIAMGFQNPMLPVTPNAYTMENEYFIPRSSTEFLDEGAIDADWTVTAGAGVWRKVYTNSTPFVAGDIGRQIIESASGPDAGTLLDFEVDPDGSLVAWIRPDTATDLFDATSGTISVVADGGTGVGNVTTVATSGQSLFSSIQVIGSVPTASEVYLIQDRLKMTDSTGGFQWWTTDTTVSLGIIDILIRVINAGTTVADGDVEVFARRYTALYDNFRLNVVAGGRSALPLASAPDINNTTGYNQTFYDGGGGTTMATGQFLTNTFAGSTGGRYVVTNVVDDSATTGAFQYYDTGDLTAFANNDTFTSTGRTGVIAGAPTNTTGGPTDPGVGEGGTVTIDLGTTTFDHDGDNTAEPYSVVVDSQNLVSAAKTYERIKWATRRGASQNDLWGTTAFNIPGETYRGMEAQAQYDAPSGTFDEGDDMTGPAGWTARNVSVNVTDTYIMITDQQTSLDAIVNDSTVFDEDSDSVVIMGTPDAFTSPKNSPLGTFTGTQIFGARGVLFLNPAPADTQNYILTDDNGVLRNPPNTIAFTVTNTAIGDRILVARDTGTGGVIDKDQFGGLTTAGSTFNGVGDLRIRVTGSIDSQVPQSGFVRVVDTGLQEEHHYVYDTLTLGANDEFNLRDIDDDGSATSNSGTQLIDTTAQFDTPQVTVGMLVRNTFAGKTREVWEVTVVDSTTTLTVQQLYGSTSDWDIGDTYTINALIGDHVGDSTNPTDYTTEENVFDLILDEESLTTADNSNTFVKTSTDFGTVVNVRQGKSILPFTQNQNVPIGGATVTVVRTPDTIAV